MAHSFLYEVSKISELSEEELKRGIFSPRQSWHREYQESAYIRFDCLHKGLTEGDVAQVFSQFGEISDVRLVRDKDTGKSRGFGFVCYEDQRSTVLAVDNMNGSPVLGKVVKVNHMREYQVPILLDRANTDADGNPVQLEYKPTGAEGHGVGVYHVTAEQKKKIQHEEMVQKERAKKEKRGGAASSLGGAVGKITDADADLLAFERGLEDHGKPNGDSSKPKKKAEKKKAEKKKRSRERRRSRDRADRGDRGDRDRDRSGREDRDRDRSGREDRDRDRSGREERDRVDHMRRSDGNGVRSGERSDGNEVRSGEDGREKKRRKRSASQESQDRSGREKKRRKRSASQESR